MKEATFKKQRVKKDKPGPFRDILDTARLLSSSEIPEKVIETVLTHLCERLGKRARCALLEGEDLKLRFWAGEHSCPVGGIKIRDNSIVWDAVRKDKPVNLTDARQSNKYEHTLSAPINVKSIIPLSYVDPLSNRKKNLGALIVDSGKEDVPISSEDFEYLQVIGQLISAIVGRTDLIQQLMESCHRQETILMEAAHNFRNSIVIIGGFSRRIAKLAEKTEMAENAADLSKEVKTLETYFTEFEKYMNLKTR
ncbi:MAG: sensor signal transduction histidine kinase [Deltaproteobacteria bacterium]|nr:sensor signal transduction histidine kinase [Deltaproteobacteria bacterium]